MPSVVGTYRLGPFLLASEIPIPELTLRELESPTPPDAFIRLGKVPEKLENVVANESRWWASRDEYLLRVPGVASFHVSRGRNIIVEPAPGALPEDIRAYLLAPIFSTLCYQSGMYALHASSVRVGEGVAAFLGHSGAGKSTLAAYLERRGYTVVSDDICLLDPRATEQGGETVVVPVAPAIKLWRSALEQLGAKPEELPRVFSRDDKYRMKIGEIDERLPLRAVFFLEWAEEPEAPPEFIPVAGVQAMTRLMEFTHFGYLMKPTGRQAESFLLGGRILSQVRAFAFRRPRNFSHIEAVIDALEQHLKTRNSRRA